MGMADSVSFSFLFIKNSFFSFHDIYIYISPVFVKAQKNYDTNKIIHGSKNSCLSNKLSKRWSFPYFRFHLPPQLFFNFMFLWVFVYFPIKRIFRYFGHVTSLNLYFLCRDSSYFQQKEDTWGEQLQNIKKNFQKVLISFLGIVWTQKGFYIKCVETNTQKASSQNNTAAQSLILTTSSVFCVSVASLVFTIYRILLGYYF